MCCIVNLTYSCLYMSLILRQMVSTVNLTGTAYSVVQPQVVLMTQLILLLIPCIGCWSRFATLTRLPSMCG